MQNDVLIYLVIENATDVCEGIERRMMAFRNWQTPGYCTSVKEAVEKLNHHRPALLFLDWSLNGGSAYEILQVVQNINGYNPYIIFNTGFQKDNPEIPQEIMNNYKVDKYLVKPYWESLRINLLQYLKEAEEKAGCQNINRQVWMEDIAGVKRLIDLAKLCCIVQHPTEQRARNFHFANTELLTIAMQWQKCYTLLNENSIDYFIAKSRSHLVVKGFVQKFEKPYLWVKGVDSFKLDVVKENIKEFEQWLVL
jgi:two-component system, LytTR family, response regulator